ncbi:hypothetical protein MPTK1_3g23000 [Marchantia polymorpha subsp. ruderalis]|uniref:Uncharacterized protein n=2 Tax=Marchantia polymorpha TaxID=3197 RepID=A0AAF6B3T1_MARPO|nr:hypothetical protein MARPO_0024s0077 [Marchantia polymorpha]BBN06665.1 hypothetical protein Mp_3g23000 [Marchantia polymorpha subsp. ruderalis]|eukprot:PTQ43564.1 hypothetical protein MARPO_0024s0077 [Marchantia polymorpha]
MALEHDMAKTERTRLAPILLVWAHTAAPALRTRDFPKLKLYIVLAVGSPRTDFPTGQAKRVVVGSPGTPASLV